MLKEKPKNRQEIINTIAGYFEYKPVLKAYLFGSFGRNEDDYEDIDIAVELDYENISWQIFKMNAELQEILGANVDIVSINGLSQGMYESIINDLNLFYEK